MKSTRSITLLLGFFFAINLFPQDYLIKGTVVDKDDKALELTNVFLYNKEGKNHIDATTTDEHGKFFFQNIQEGEYRLRVIYFEQEGEVLHFLLDANLDLGKITIGNPFELNEVEVLAAKPKLERRADRYIYTVKNTSLVQGNIMESLSRTPGIFMINDQLTFKGEANIGVMVNDKLVNLPIKNVLDLLKSTSAGNIESIEVITNPPARYSAEGGILINIKMSDNLIAGYNGSLNANYGQGDFPKYNIGTDHFFKSKKTAITLNYNYRDEKGIVGFLDNTYFLEDTGSSQWEADQRRIRNDVSHNVGLFSDFQLGAYTNLNVTSINQFSPRNDQDISIQTRILGETEENFSSFVSENQAERTSLSSSSYIGLEHRFPNSKNTLSTTFHFTYFENDRAQQVLNDFFDDDGAITDEIDFNTFSNQQIRIYTGQLDYDAGLGKKGTYALGIKYAGIDSRSKLEQEGTENLSAEVLADEGLFDYEEQIYAGYGNLDLDWQKLQLGLGIRVEYTETLGVLEDTEESFGNSYIEWFPSFSIKYDFKNDRNVLLYYYRRITRPRYNQINPFQLFQGYNSTVEGNPRLLPSTRHYLAGGYNFNSWLGLELFYRYRKNQLRSLTFQDNENTIIRYISSNVDRELGYGLDVIVNKNITSFWQTYVLATYYYVDNRFQDLVSGNFASTNGWTFSFTNNNSFALLPKQELSIDLDIRYRSAFAYGNARENAYGSVNLSLRKMLWDGRGSIGAGVTDIFSQRAYTEERVFLDQNNTTFYNPETPIANFSFRYQFGNTTIKSNKKAKRQQEVDRL